MALISQKHAENNSASIFTQQDVKIEEGYDVTYATEYPFDPPPSYIIAKEGIAWAQERGLNELVILAATPHLPRCIRDVKKVLSENNIKIKVTEKKYLQKHSWFDINSQQKRTQSYKNWWLREWVLMNMPFCLYKKISLNYYKTQEK